MRSVGAISGFGQGVFNEMVENDGNFSWGDVFGSTLGGALGGLGGGAFTQLGKTAGSGIMQYYVGPLFGGVGAIVFSFDQNPCDNGETCI